MEVKNKNNLLYLLICYFYFLVIIEKRKVFIVMENNFLSKGLENYLLKKTNKSCISDINIDDIEEISLCNLDEEKFLVDFRDFEKFKNLKYLSLKNFKIDNYQTNEINRCKKISALQFSNCIINSKSRLQNNIQVLSFDNCKKLDLHYISLLKDLNILKLINLGRINLKNIGYVKNVGRIYFENDNIINLKALAELSNLNYIRVINCKYNKN